MTYLVYIDRGYQHLGVLSAFELEFAELIRSLLEQHSAEYKIEIRALSSPGQEKKGS